MKRIIQLFIGGLLATATMAQAPQGISYQAVLRDGSGAIEANTSGTLGLAILQGSATGTVVYSETHAVTSNGFGLVNVTLGGGTVTTGNFANIDWSTGAYWVRTALNGTVLGSSKLESVPYALYAPNTAFNGSANKLVRFTSATTGASSQVFDNGTLVGIGTTTPQAQLEIQYNSSPTIPQLKLRQPNDAYSRLHFQNTNTGAWVLAGYKGTTAASSLFNVFYSEGENGDGGSDIMSVSGQGKVGINMSSSGTGAFDATLGIRSSSPFTDNLSFLNNSNQHKWGFYVNDFGGDLVLHYFDAAGTALGSGSFNKTSGAYSSISDMRLKENITPVADVLGRLKDVQVMNYTFKTDSKHTPQLGYIAQNLEEHFPEFVNKPEEVEGKESAYTVNYAGMSAVAIKAIQEQQEMIQKQQELLERMEERIQQLEAR